MKKFWKVLGITALAAALVPYRVEKDDKNGDVTFNALLWQGKKSIRDGEKHINVNFAPWFSPNRTDDLDSLELPNDDDVDDLDGLDDLDVELDGLDAELDDLDTEITTSVQKDEPEAPQA